MDIKHFRNFELQNNLQIFAVSGHENYKFLKKSQPSKLGHYILKNFVVDSATDISIKNFPVIFLTLMTHEL